VAETEVALLQEQEPAADGGMSGSVEASRRHGRFDLRWGRGLYAAPPIGRAPVVIDLEGVLDGLDWFAFSTRYVPRSRRNDLASAQRLRRVQARPVAE
jgi:hypothetical protein